jgi:hypothetical protein
MNQGLEASSWSQHVRLTPVRVHRSRLSPLEALERGFALFRSTFAREAWRYYFGAAPFVVCFIPIWVINGQIRISDRALLMEVALLAGAYVLRVWMIASYMQHGSVHLICQHRNLQVQLRKRLLWDAYLHGRSC